MPKASPPVTARLPLPALLSQVLVAFTMEFDNAFEQRVPHCITIAPETRGQGLPWLVSLAMWANFMQYVGDGITLGELAGQARMPEKFVLAFAERMSAWWGYVRIRSSERGGAVRQKKPRRDATAVPTAAGARASAAWAPLGAEIEARWSDRFGEAAIRALREALTQVVAQLGPLPAYLPVIDRGLFTPYVSPGGETVLAEAAVLPLSELVARPLLALTLAFERDAKLSLPVYANIVRLLPTDAAVRASDLAPRAGITKDAVAAVLSYLNKRGSVGIETAPEGRVRVVRLTPRGAREREAAEQRIADIESAWREQFGGAAVDALRAALDRVCGEPGARSPLLQCVVPPEGGWRARFPMPETLPWQPVISHRGGFPDGA